MSINPLARRSQMAPVGRAVRAYVAPVDRPSGVIMPFDPAAQGQFDLDSPPPPWLDLGWIENFQRTAATKYDALRSGPSGTITVQYRSQPEARVDFDLPSWGKLQMAIAGGSQQMNVLAVLPLEPAPRFGRHGDSAISLAAGFHRDRANTHADQLANYNVGDIVAVDSDYTGTIGYVGAGAPAAYLSSPLNPSTQSDFIRRVTFNVSRVSSKTPTSLLLAQPLIGVPTTGMGVQKSRGVRGPRGQQLLPGVVRPVRHRRRDRRSRVLLLSPPPGGSQWRGNPARIRLLRCSVTCCTPACTLCPPLTINDNETVLCYRSYFPTPDAALF